MVIVPVTVFLLAAALNLISLNRYLSTNLAPLIAQIIGPAIHREARIARLDFLDYPGRIVIEGLELSNGATFAGDKDGLAFLRARRVVVHYNLPLILKDVSNIPIALGDIDVEGATAYAERTSLASWNFSDLIPKQELREQKLYAGVLSVRHSTVYFHDQSASKSLLGRVERIDNVSVNVDFRSTRAYRFWATGKSVNDLFSSGAISGVILRNPLGPVLRRSDRGFRIHIALTRGSARFLAADFIPWIQSKIRVDGGYVDADVTVSKAGNLRSTPVDLQGFVHVANGVVVDEPHLLLAHPATDVTGDVFFTLHQATVALSARTDGVPLTINGAIFGFPAVELALRVDAAQLPVDRLHTILTFVPSLPSQVAIPQPATATALITGEAGDPTARISVAAPTVLVAGCPFTDVHLDTTYVRGLIALNALTAKASPGGGTFSAEGLVDARPTPNACVFRGVFTDVPLDSLSIVKSAQRQLGAVTGLANASFVVSSGRPAPPSQHSIERLGKSDAPLGPISARVSLRVRQATVRGYSIPRIACVASYDQGVGITIPEFLAQDARGGALLVRGAIPMIAKAPARYDIRVNAARIQFGGLLGAFGIPDVRGTGYFQGRAIGPLSSPDLEGRISLVDVRYKKKAIDLANGVVRVHDGNVGFDDLSIHVEPALATINGVVIGVLSKNPQLNLRVGVNRIQLTELMSLLPEDLVTKSQSPNMSRVAKTATGSLNGMFEITGSMEVPRLRADVSVANATFDAYRFQDIRGSFDYDAGTVQVRQLRASWEDARLEAAGSFNTSSKEVSATFTGNGLDAGRLMHFIDPDVVASGILSVAGTVRGTASDPDVSAQTVTDRLKIGAFTLESVRAAGQYHHGVFSSTGVPIVLSLAGATYTVSRYRYDMSTKDIALDASVADQKLSVFLTRLESTSAIMSRLSPKVSTALRQLPSPLDGDVTIPRLAVTGTLDKPTITVAADIKNLTIGNNFLNELSFDFDFGGTKLTVRSLRARSQIAYLSASGSIDLAGAIEAKLEASNVNLSFLAPLLPPGVKVGGSISDLTVIAAGKTKDPEVTASVTLAHLSYGSISFDRVESGRMTIAKSQLTIDGLRLVKDEAVPGGDPVEHLASIHGSIPFAWNASSGTPMPFFPTNVPIDLHASIPEQSLSVLSMFAPALQNSAFSGLFKADVNISGTLADKRLAGQIAIVHGQVRPPGYQSGLKNIDALINLNGNTATIERASAESLQKNGGSLSASGSIMLLGARPAVSGLADALLGGVKLDLVAKADRFKFAESKIRDYGNAGASGVVTGELHATDIATAPLVSGKIEVDDAVITLPNTEAVQQTPDANPPVNPRFNVALRIDRGAHIDSSQVKVSDASGDFKLIGTLAVPNLHGRLFIDKGVFDLPTARFRVLPGGVAEVAYNPATPTDQNGLTVTVNLQARTSLSISQRTLTSSPGLSSGVSATPSLLGTYAGSEHYTITAQISGTLKSDGTGLQLTFTSDPPLAESQIIAALGGQSMRDIGTGAVDTGVRSLFAQVLTNQLSASVFESIYDVTGLDVTVDYTPELPFVVTLTKQLLPRVSATFTSLGTSRTAGAVASTVGPPQYQLLLGYNLNNRLSLILSADDQGDYGAGLEGVFRF